MKRPTWTRHLLTESRKDPIPEWLIWPAFVLSAVSIVYGATEDPHGFLLNVAASLSLIGPGLFITNRVVRNWNDSRLQPVLRHATEYLRLALEWLWKDISGADADVDLRDELPQLSKDKSVLDTFNELASCAAVWKEAVEGRALVALGTAVVGERPKRLTVGHAVEQLDANIDRLDVALDLSEVREWRERMLSAAQEWESYRGKKDTKVNILLAAVQVLDSIHSLTPQLTKILPKHLT